MSSHEPPNIDELLFQPSSQDSNKVDVFLKWSVPGDMPDSFKIFVNSQLIQEVVDVSKTELTLFRLLRNKPYAFMVCCEWDATDEHTSDEKCSSIVTTPPPPPASGGGGGASQLTPPVITSTRPLPATIQHKNRIEISWSSSQDYDSYRVSWRTTYDSFFAKEDIDSGGRTGSYTREPTMPGFQYIFIVEGCYQKLLGGSTCSDWSERVEATAVHNLTSLAEFLRESGIDPRGQRLRSLMPPGTTLRKFMKL